MVPRALDGQRRGADQAGVVAERDAMQPFKAVPVVRAALGDNAGLVGAAALAIERTRGEG